MPDIFETLLGIGITAGLSDREVFVGEVSTIIQEYQNDPDKARKWAKAVVEYLETKRDNINLEHAIKNVAAEPLADKKQIEKLTLAIKELTAELQKNRAGK